MKIITYNVPCKVVLDSKGKSSTIEFDEKEKTLEKEQPVELSSNEILKTSSSLARENDEEIMLAKSMGTKEGFITNVKRKILAE